MMTLGNNKIVFDIFISTGLTLLLTLTLSGKPVSAAACTAKGGEASYNVSIETSATYIIWLRMQASGNNNGLYVDIDGQQCLLAGDSTAISSSNWTWVDYTNGNNSQKARINLAKGNHSIKIIGHENGVKLDKLILTSDSSCIPENFGDNCVISTPQPTKLGDINADNKVDIFDLSILLSRWQAQSNNERADLNGDGVVNIFDLSTLLSRWGS